ncbi:MAG TPA: twin-arginine translocase subunit TatB [Gammaproteobacteria bacterium]|nr:twin-arginine translocase subunit TatB [Gammaproteobacteria bacterium]
MFDIGFFEIALVCLVALIVIGPDRLPALARTAGLWIGKGQAMVRSVKADIDRELAASEMQGRSTGKEERESVTDLLTEAKELAEEVRCNFRLDASGQVASHTTSPERKNAAETG